VVWDANNETENATFLESIIPAVRPLDLSKRPWENSYNPPADPNDPVEDHPYLMSGGYFGKLTFKMSDLETRDGAPDPKALPAPDNPPLVNEYGWIWLNRDGSPTRLTESVYTQLMGENTTARERLDMWAYLLAGKTEFWRAHRKYAGIIHFVYLTCSYPGVYTSDHFRDVTRLELDPAFADYVAEAFQPLGVYINFFQPTLKANEEHTFRVMLVNDYSQAVSGNLTLSVEDASGKTLISTSQRYEMAAAGDTSVDLKLTVPAAAGKCTLKAVAGLDGEKQIAPTVSRRWVTIE
jgi:beta-galactosidase